jgi:hypothetical protein
MMTSVPDYVRGSGGPEAVFARARRAALAEDKEHGGAAVGASAVRQPSGGHPARVPCANGLPRNGQVYKIDGKLFSHAYGVSSRS